MQITLNTDYARAGDTGSARITESGGYVGKFTMAKQVKTTGGTVGIEFDFEDNAGRSAKYLTIYTHKDGKETWGFKQLHAIMTCIGTRSISGVNMQAKVYDFEQKKEVEKQVVGYPELINVPVGVILVKEHYTNGNGEDKEKMSISAVYDAETKCTATEKLDKQPASTIENLLKNLTDKDNRKTKGTRAPAGEPAPVSENPAPSGGADINFDDDIPFMRVDSFYS